MPGICIYTYAHSHNLDLDVRSQWLGKGQHSVLSYLDNKASNKHSRLNSVSHDLDFVNIYNVYGLTQHLVFCCCFGFFVCKGSGSISHCS